MMDQSFLLLEDAVFNSLSVGSKLPETMFTNETDTCDDSGFETTNTYFSDNSNVYQTPFTQNSFGFQANIDQHSSVQSYFPPVARDPISRFDFRPNFVSKQECEEKLELLITTQPTRNHRARYKTEGSRGAIKDRSGRGFPVIKLKGYNKSPVKLRCYIGHDDKLGEPHLFYQSSKIVGKHLTPSQVKKIEGIKVVEMELLPEQGMQAVINCIGIVKERNF
ncbi:Rely domain (RHD) containing protein-like protein, partial [Leptotrombidium deliense]